jgi:hypothetical protein
MKRLCVVEVERAKKGTYIDWIKSCYYAMAVACQALGELPLRIRVPPRAVG